MAATAQPSDKPVIGILSLGEMGTGIAKLLLAHDYEVATCTQGRSKYTLRRIQEANIKAYDTDSKFVAEVDVLLSIVPPRDATATAVRMLEASRNVDAIKRRKERLAEATSDTNLIYIDCNAISAKTSRNIAAFFVPQEGSSEDLSRSGSGSRPGSQSSSAPAPPPRRFSLARLLSSDAPTTAEPGSLAGPSAPIKIVYLDGGIIGSPPSQTKTATNSADKTNNNTNTSPSSSKTPGPSTQPSPSEWKRPSLVLSGPSITTLLPSSLLTTLNATAISPTIGAASTLKSCFAATTKGLTALLTLSLATASQSHVLPHLLSHLETYAPQLLTAAQGSMPTMPPKAYRWVEEMRQIGSTFATEGGLECGETVFGGVAELYRFVSEDTVLGKERTESRKRGRTAEDVAACVAEGVREKRKKAEKADEVGGKLVWRGSWD
ncbi:uncharacterized protein AB675_4978 [Cyphellophora attinorum]|uniref:Phosphogluconate dehydrogenase NAD-binding putative C-terminal domain-containing protein n=1 Tax=Cyphellophora attinorum TaxID=1664694 RepID=A0A0N0NLU9_9EURO|nr:uncharacterized protein AB675_4978 [Phialophora attinorum]KPI39459.1 hypothetical protein AB675_4978 [Phialophora attinorum]